MKRYGQIINLKDGVLDTYKKYHAAIWPEVADKIRDCNIKNYSIYHMNGVLFSYFEYHGTDFDADMAKMAADPKTQEWWAVMKPMQDPVEGTDDGEWWATMEEVFHQD